MASKRHIEHQRVTSTIAHYILDTCYEHTTIPREGTAWLENHTKVGITRAEITQDVNKTLLVVVGVGKQMSATKVYPRQLVKVAGETLLDSAQCGLQILGT